MIHARVRTIGGVCQTEPSPERLHPLLEDRNNLVWLDLEAPTPDEIGLVGGILGWEHLTVEDLTKQGQRAKLEQFNGYVYLVMHALAYDGDPARLTTHEVDFVAGPNYVVSSHQAPLPAITESREVSHHTESCVRIGPDYLLYALTDRLVDSYFPELDKMDDAVDELEDRIVADPDRALMTRIFEMKRDAVTLRKVISPLADVFTRLTGRGLGVVGDEQVMYFRDVHDHLFRALERVEGYREMMAGALDAYLSTVSNRMNEVMKGLTVFAALFLPITFITGLLGMNLRQTPPWSDALFWVLIGAMVVFMVLMWAYLRRKRWV